MCGFSRANCGVEGLGERTASMFIFGVEICGPVGNGERYPNVCEQVTLEFWRIPQPQITEIGSCAADIAEEIFILGIEIRSEEHTSELQSLMRISYAVFCLKKKTKN